MVAAPAEAYLKPANRTVGMFLPGKAPDRAPLPAMPDVAKLVKDYKGEQAVAEGETFEATLDNILNWRNGEFSEKHRAVLAFAEESTRNVTIGDATFDGVRPHLNPRQIVELMTTVAYYNMVSRFLVGLRVDLEE